MMSRRQFSASSVAFATFPTLSFGKGLAGEDPEGGSGSALVTKRVSALFGGRKLSLLGFGTASGLCYENRAEADRCLDYALRSGVNYFDTAYNYHGGNAELFLSEGLKGLPRDSYFLCDKMPTWLIKSLDDAKRIFNEQLKRCGVDYFDNYMLHSIRDEKDYERVYLQYGVLDFLLNQKEKGLIRHLGFSFHGRVPLLERLLSSRAFEMVQLSLNALEWEGPNQARMCYELCHKKDVPVFVMQPLAHGRLAQLKPTAEKLLRDVRPDKSAASWSFRFVAGLPGVACVLSGPGKFGHMVENVQTFEERSFEALSNEELDIYRKAISIELSGQKLIPCTGCRYCMPCKYGVDIVDVFMWWNDLLRNGRLPTRSDAPSVRRRFLRDYYNRFPVGRAGGGAAYCIGCRKCEDACPQWQFVISDEPVKIDEYVESIRALDPDFRPNDRVQGIIDRMRSRLKI